MTWVKGQTGNPRGAPKKWNILSTALKVHLSEDPLRARRIAEKLSELAEEGDLDAMRLIFDRVEGKAHQSIGIEATVVMSREEREDRVRELQAKLISARSSATDLEPIQEAPALPAFSMPRPKAPAKRPAKAGKTAGKRNGAH